VQSWSVEIPQGVRQVIGRRLNTLSEECNRVLAIASVIGREFDLALLAQVAELAEDALLDVLEQAEDARIVAEADARSEAYRFAHALIRETLYDELRTTRRIRLHRRIAEVIEDRHAERLEPRLAELAYHFGEAASGGDVEKAVDYAVRAAGREMDLVAYEEAAKLYERALQALEASQPVDEARRCELLILLAEAQARSGGLNSSWETAREALALARRLGQAASFGRAVAALCVAPSARWPIPDAERIEALEEALERLGQADSALRARLMARLGWELSFARGERERCESLVREGIEVARRSGDRAALAAALTVRLDISTARDPEADLAAADEIIAIAQEGGARFEEFYARNQRMSALVLLGEAEAFDSELEAQPRLAEEVRVPITAVWIAEGQAQRALWEGRLADARAFSWEMWTGGRPRQEGVWRQVYGLQTWALRRLQGRLSETLPTLLVGVQQPQHLQVWDCLLACAYAESGQERDARRVFEEIVSEDLAAEGEETGSTSAAQMSSWPPYNLGLLADACAWLRDAARARPLYESLSSYSGLYLANAGVSTNGSAARALGQLAATMGRFADAERHFEQAILADTRMRARGWLPRTQCDYARMLLDRGAPGDREKSLTLLGEALDTCQELGLKGWLDMCLEQKLRAQGVDSGTLLTTIHAIADSIEQRRPDLRPHASPDGTVTLMFSDMEDYTGMLERLGDLAAHELVQSHNAIVREQTRAHGGHEVELRGDGFLLAFASARQAVLCAIALQRAFAARAADDPGEEIRIRIGVHTGEAIKDADKFFGKSVVQAFRVADLAAGGELLVSSLTKDLVASAGDLAFDEGREVSLKGLAGMHRVFPVRWE
ncbi:MAG: adenylate/guanylate cyclase domain-containing protein, partial [Myxococcota bacterium]